MKSSAKSLLCTAAVLILVGGSFIAGALVAGATGYQRDFGRFKISIGIHGFQIGSSGSYQVIDSVTVQEGTAEYATGQEIPPEDQQWAETPKMTWTNTDKYGEIPLAWDSLTHLDINLTAAGFKIVRTESEAFLRWDGIKSDTLSFTITDGCFYLTQDDPYNGLVPDLTYMHDGMDITLGLPDGVAIEEMSFYSGMGDLKIDEGAVGSASVKMGLGDFEGEDVYFGHLEADVGTGDIELGNCSADELNLHSGMGKVEYQGGILYGTAVMESGLGDVRLNIDNPLSDYSLDLSSGLGEVKVNGNNYGTDYELTVEDAPLLELHTGMGKVTLETK